MGFTVWDREKGGPARTTLYHTRKRAEAVAAHLNGKHDADDRFYVKGL